jgi:hypothetical protein
MNNIRNMDNLVIMNNIRNMNDLDNMNNIRNIDNLENSKIELVSFFFTLRNKLYYYHLTTEKYPRHVSAASLVDSMDKLIDNFLEVLYGKYNRPHNSEFTIKVNKMCDADALFYLDECIQFLTGKLPSLIKATDSDLLNIRDEMTGLLNRSKYLFVLQ